MAKSLDNLIQYLLEEIALAGSDGISFDDFRVLIRAFYEDAKTLVEREALRETKSDNAANNSPQNVDRQFLAKVWTWLVRNPDVSVGPDHDYGTLTLDELDARFPNFTTPKGSTQSAIRDSTVTSEADADVGPRIYVNEDRAYLAICGHPPDPTRVFPSEWSLLCTIAATREYGILQGELGRITGQDKRSVPKRTDVLQDKGYIVKKIVYTGGHRTSRLLLKRFAFGTDGGASNSSLSSLAPKVKDIALRILAAIKGGQIVPIDDIAQAIGMKEPIQIIAITTIIRHFVHAGCLKRVKTAFGPAATSQDMKICYQLLRQPNDEEWHTGANTTFDFDDLFDDLVAATSDNQPQDQADGLNDTDEHAHVNAEHDSTRPQWNIDRILPNVIRDVAVAAGTEGITNVSTRMAITGPFVRRPVEATLVRLSHAAPRYQPDQVRHLAIVRSAEIRNSAPTYVHRTIQTYKDMVVSRKADWADVGSGKEINKAETNVELANKTLRRDVFGFVVRTKPGSFLGDGDVTLSDAVSAAKAKDMNPGIPRTLLQLENIILSDQEAEQEIRATEKQLKKEERGKRTYKKRQKTVIGRPRRFKKGTEKFWRDMFMLAKREADPNAGSTVGKAGLMTDPAGLEVFNNRPAEFDDVLLYAMDNDLPIPCSPKDVTQRWVDVMTRMRDREAVGWYITMVGMTNQSRMMRSCVCVLRSSRLLEVDFSDERVAGSNMQSRSVPDSAVLDLFLPGYGPDKKPPSRAPRSKVRKKKKEDADRHRASTEEQQDVEMADAPAPDSATKFISELQLEAFKPTSQGPLSSTPLDAEMIDSELRTFTAPTVESSEPAPTVSVADGIGSDHKALAVQESVANEPMPILRSTLTGEHALIFDADSRQHSSDVSKDAFVRQTGAVEELPQSNPAQSRDRIEVVDDHHASEESISQSESHRAEPAALSQTGMNEAKVHPDKVQAENGSFHLSSAMPNEAVDNSDDSEAVQSRTRKCGSKDNGPADQAPTNDVDDDEYHASAQEVPRTPNPGKRKRVTKNTRLKKRSRELLIGRLAVAYYREFVMQLVRMCQGAVPYDASMLKRAMKTKCIEANVDDQPNIKLVKAQIKALCDQGRLKQMYISYRWNGAIHKKQILALPKVTSTDIAFQAMSTKITNMPPEEDHVPPEMQAEEVRQPVIPDTSEDTASASDVPSETATPARRPKRRRTASEKAKASVVSRENGASPGNESSDPEQLQSTPTNDNKRSRGRSTRSRSTNIASFISEPEVGPNTGFLTLKVPGIASVRAEANFTSHYFTLPPAPLRFDLDANTVEIPSFDDKPTEKLPIGQRRRGRPRRAKPSALPESLDEILGQDKRDHSAEVALADDPVQARFDVEVDWVAEWEMRSEEQNLTKPVVGGWNFINHKLLNQKHACRTISALSNLRLVYFDDDGMELERDAPAVRSWPPFVEALQYLDQAPAKAPRRIGGGRKRKVVEIEDSGYEDADAEYELEEDYRPGPRRTKEQRKAAAVMFRGRRDPANYDNILDVDKTRRRGQGLRNLSPQEVHRLSTAIVMVRVLAGGLHHYIDWSLVAKVSPNETVHTLKQRWKVMAARFMPEIDALGQSFQVRYLDALANGEVPSIDFENIDNSDWQGILDWAVQNVDANSRAMALGLLTTREELLEKHKVSLEERDNVRTLQAHGMIFTSQMREQGHYSTVFGQATYQHFTNSPAALGPDRNLQNLECTARETEELSAEKSLARSFVLASVLTPAETFSRLRTHEKLLKLAPGNQNRAEHLVTDALASLNRDRLISKRNKNASTEDSTTSGTKDWMINTQRFHQPLLTYRMVTAPMLKTAAYYKLSVLDMAFRSALQVTLPKGTGDRDDGEMLAVLNLVSMGMIRLKPSNDVPGSRYGLDWERQGYKTKSMDNDVLEFGVVVEPTGKYVYGNILGRQHHSNIPEGELRQSDGRGRIPAWFDINLDFRADIWELYISAVIGTVSLRPGISVLELCKTLSWVLAQEDVMMIMQWLEGAGVVRCTGSERNWETTEWWWMILCQH